MILALVLGLALAAHARTWYVLPDATGNAPAIQAAVDSSGDGDTVLVAAGTYYGYVQVTGLDNIGAQLYGRLSRDDRILLPASDLLGESVRLFKDKIIAKFPGVCGCSLHQDFAYWQGTGIPPGETFTVYISIDRAAFDNGAMEFILGYHDQVFHRPG